MTEFEIATLQMELANNLSSSVMSFATIMFAFLVAAFFIGARSPKWIIILLSVIYSLFCFMSVGGTFGILSALQALREETGSIPSDQLGPYLLRIWELGSESGGFVSFGLLLGGAYLGSLLFLIYIVRNKNGANET